METSGNTSTKNGATIAENPRQTDTPIEHVTAYYFPSTGEYGVIRGRRASYGEAPTNRRPT